MMDADGWDGCGEVRMDEDGCGWVWRCEDGCGGVRMDVEG